MSGAHSKPQWPQAWEAFKKKKNPNKQREKRGNSGSLKIQSFYLFNIFSLLCIFFLYLFFNILSKSGITKAACKSFLLSTCTTEHSATQAPKTKQQDKDTEGSESSVPQQAITVVPLCQEWRHKAMQERITTTSTIIKSVFWCFLCEPSAIIYSTT